MSIEQDHGAPVPGPAAIAKVLQAALNLTKYAAAPFFGGTTVQGTGEDAERVQRTTRQWWDGLREQIEAIQPELEKAMNQPLQSPSQMADPWARELLERAVGYVRGGSCGEGEREADELSANIHAYLDGTSTTTIEEINWGKSTAQVDFMKAISEASKSPK